MGLHRKTKDVFARILSRSKILPPRPTLWIYLGNQLTMILFCFCSSSNRITWALIACTSPDGTCSTLSYSTRAYVPLPSPCPPPLFPRPLPHIPHLFWLVKNWKTVVLVLNALAADPALWWWTDKVLLVWPAVSCHHTSILLLRCSDDHEIASMLVAVYRD